jgi:hypothetical protein
MKNAIALIFIVCYSGLSYPQSGTAVFNDTLLHEVRLQIADEDWFEQLENNYELNLKDPEKYPEKYLPCNAIIDGRAIDSIGIRQKGNYSNTVNRQFKKKPFKLAFDAFREQRFNGLKKINLNNGTDDPGFFRESLVYKLLRDEGIAAPRTAFAKIYINDIYWGLYEMVENVDKTFLKDKYGPKNNEGNLYKTDRGAKVQLNAVDKDKNNEAKSLLLKTNENTGDWERVNHFIDVINTVSPADVKDSLGAIFDVGTYLKILAIEKLAYSWDSYWGSGNNFYLYEHPDGKIRWIPWDFNESFQKHKGLLKLILPSPEYLIPTDRFDKRPLLKNIFSVPEWKKMYLEYVCYFISEKFNVVHIAPLLVKWHSLIAEAYREDENRLDPVESFEHALTEESTHKIDFVQTGFAFEITLPGILPFIEAQREWASSQMEEHKFPCGYSRKIDVYNISLFPIPATDKLNISWTADSVNVSQIVVLNSAGQAVMTTGWIYYNGTTEIQITLDLPEPGFYIIKKQDVNGNLGYGKLIKQ